MKQHPLSPLVILSSVSCFSGALISPHWDAPGVGGKEGLYELPGLNSAEGIQCRCWQNGGKKKQDLTHFHIIKLAFSSSEALDIVKMSL